MSAKQQQLEDGANPSESGACVNEGLRSLDAYALAAHIRNGAIGIIETDTLYGLVGSAFFPDVVNRIYQIKRRNFNKPLIILVSDVEQMKYFGIELTKDVLRGIRTYWPGKFSIIMPTTQNDRFDYLTRGTGKLCFRMPDRADLFELIDLAGPIVAPSANPEGDPPATTIEEAREYFGEEIDFYCDAGKVDRAASTIIEFVDGEVKEIR